MEATRATRIRGMLGVLLTLGLLAAQTPSQAEATRMPVRALLAAPGGPSGGALLYNHQDCIDEAAGVLGARGHGSHVSAPFISPAGTMFLTLDPINIGRATCLATAAAGLPPRNAYVGHYEFVLTDTHPTAVPFGEGRERFRCEYIGLPVISELGNFSCTGLRTFWVGRQHTITIIVEPSATVLGLPVPSVGAMELTVSS